VLAAGSAHADDRLSPRQQQALALRAEMAQMAARDGWRGVEADYSVLVGLADRGVRLTATDHRLGAQAAQSRGEIDLAQRRLVLALDLEPDPSAAAMKADLDLRFAPVTLDAPDRAPLAWLDSERRSDAVAAVGLAAEIVEDRGAWVGWLPLGTYQLGQKRFVVDGVDLPLVVSTRATPRPPRRQRAGITVDAGPALLAIGGSDATGVQAAPATLFGPQVDASYVTRLQDRLGVGGGLTLSGGAEASPPDTGVFGQSPASTKFIMGTFHGDLVLGAAPVQVAFGPAWTLGGGAARAACDGCGATDPAPGLSGRFGLLGGQVVLAAVPPTGQWGASLAFRLQSDGDRSWMGVALSGRYLFGDGRL
jgi:hypothetical protein